MSLDQCRNVIAFVQGASRGLGLEMVRQLVEKPQVKKVYASCRSPDQADDLQTLASQFAGRVCIVKIDVTDEASIEAAAALVKDQSQRLHFLINCAGLLHSPKNRMKPEKRLEDLNADNLEASLRVNAIGPILIIKHFVQVFKHSEMSVVANISARVGSISDNKLGGWYSYRAAKAAQNMLTKTVSWELQRRCEQTIAVALHPGTVDTDMSRPFQAGVPAERLFSVARAAKQLVDICWQLDSDANGKFFAWDGQEIPW